MLSIPFKKADASTDLAGPLRRYLMKEFSKEEVEKYKGDLDELQRLRSKAIQVERPSGEGRECLMRYFSQLEALEPVFPVSETEVRVGFKWGDAFNPNKKSNQSTLLFERACVLYNLGAHESRSASQEDRSTDPGLKEACYRFQVAAGIFQHIRERIVGGLVGTLTQDLIPDGLTAASTLMLAQAQACFYERAVKDRAKTKMKPSLIAKLASKASEFYKQTLNLMHGPNLAPGMDRSWPAHVEFQSIAFEAAAYYWESISRHEVADETGSGYGMEITLLQQTSDMLEQALRLAHRQALSSTFTSSADSMNANVRKTLASCKKDNATVYMEVVPAKSSLRPIIGASMVKAIAFIEAPRTVEGSIGGQPALFVGLLSKSAKAALEEYKKKESEVVGGLDARVKEQTSAARNKLAEVGLPGTVEAHVSVEGIPESVWKKVQAVKQGGGGLEELKTKSSAVEASAERARSTLEGIERTLDEDERQDESFRRRYSGEYEGMSTKDLAKDLRRDVEHYRELWRTGRQTDAKVMSRIEDTSNREGLELLELRRQALDAAMPAGKGAGAEEVGGGIQTEVLLAKLVEMTVLLADRETKLSTLTEFVKTRNVAPELAKVSRSSGGGAEGYTGAVEVALQGLVPLSTVIEANLAAQSPLLEQILAENDKFQQARASDRETLEREAFLQKIHSSVMLFHEVHAQLSEGTMFYADLLQRLAQLNQTCEDLVYTQGLHRREFEVGYTHRRERAIMEGEDASIELARQMEAQASVAQGSKIVPAPAKPPAADGAPKTGGYSSGSRGAYGQVPWSPFSSSRTPGNPPQARPEQNAFQPPQQSPYQPAQQPYQPAQQPYKPAQQPYQPAQQPYQPAQQPYQPAQQPYQTAQQPYQSPYQPPQQPYKAPQQAYHAPQQQYQTPQEPYPAPQPQPHHYSYAPPPVPTQTQSPYQSAQPHGHHGAPPQPQAAAPGTPYYRQDGMGGSGAHAPPAPGTGGYGSGAPSAVPSSATVPPSARAHAPSTTPRWGPWLRPQDPPATESGAPTAAPAAVPADPNEDKVKRLLEMGFDLAKTRAALAESKGDESAAISKLLSEA